jgi:hypothetical protein
VILHILYAFSFTLLHEKNLYQTPPPPDPPPAEPPPPEELGLFAIVYQ